MRVTKTAQERKDEILDAANTLFAEKGFDGTSISDILKKVGIARGTIYYHFESKEEIMNALVERQIESLLEGARNIASNKTTPVLERLIQTIISMNVPADSQMNQHIHRPQNALMNQKIGTMILQDFTPILTEIVEDGIKEGMFNTPFPYETVEMIVANANTVFNYNHMLGLSKPEQASRSKAFIYNMNDFLPPKKVVFLHFLKYFITIGEQMSNAKDNSFLKFSVLCLGGFVAAIGNGITSFGIGIYVFQLTGLA